MLGVLDNNNVPNIKVWSKVHLVLALHDVASNPLLSVMHGSDAGVV